MHHLHIGDMMMKEGEEGGGKPVDESGQNRRTWPRMPITSEEWLMEAVDAHADKLPDSMYLLACEKANNIRKAREMLLKWRCNHRSLRQWRCQRRSFLKRIDEIGWAQREIIESFVRGLEEGAGRS